MKLQHKDFLTFVIGLVIYYGAFLILSLASMLMSSYIMLMFPVDQIVSVNAHAPFLAITYLLRVLSYLFIIFTGFVVGIRSNKSIKNGLIIGVIISMIGILFAIAMLLIPPHFFYGQKSGTYSSIYYSKLWNSLWSGLLYSPLTIFLTGIGGFLSTLKRKKVTH